MEQDVKRVAVIHPAHAKALKGHKTDARDALRLVELFECGLLHGSYIPSQELKDLRTWRSAGCGPPRSWRTCPRR